MKTATPAGTAVLKAEMILLMLLGLAFSCGLLAQSPGKLSYQAVIRNSEGQLVANRTVGMKVSILKDSGTGIPVLIETHQPQTNENGLVAIEIGSGTTVQGSFSGIEWWSGSYYLKTETDPEGGTGYTISGTSQLLSVPYALHAKTAEGIAGKGFEHYIGELWGGGIVVSVWKVDGEEHGLIASLSDLSATAVWSNVTDAPIGSAAQSPVDGPANTRAIISQAGHTESAAKLCDDYSHDGFTDWYLPAAWELDQCYNAALMVNSVLGSSNGFKFDIYWGSTEDPYDGTAGWIKIFYSGKSGSVIKDATTRVRAVRRF